MCPHVRACIHIHTWCVNQPVDHLDTLAISVNFNIFGSMPIFSLLSVRSETGTVWELNLILLCRVG